MRISRSLAAGALTVALSVGAGACSALAEAQPSARVTPSGTAVASPTPSPSASAPEMTVQDVTGMNAADAIDALELLGLEVELDAGGKLVLVKSNWTVTGMDPAPGSIVEVGSTVTLTVSKEAGAQDDEEEERRTTAAGLTQGMAMTVCTHAGEDAHPYGFDVKALSGGFIDVTEETVYIDVTVEVTNAAGASRVTTMECTVGGSDQAPQVVDFFVYD